MLSWGGAGVEKPVLYFRSRPFRRTLRLSLRPCSSANAPSPPFQVKQVEATTFQLREKLDAEFSQGPLSLLLKFLRDRVRVCVYMRSQRGFRSRLDGFLDAFDRHQNLLLVDVHERYAKRLILHVL